MKRLFYLGLFFFLSVPLFFACGDKENGGNDNNGPIITIDDYIGTWQEQITSFDTLWLKIPEMLPVEIPITPDMLFEEEDLQEIKSARDTVEIMKLNNNKISYNSASGRDFEGNISGASLTLEAVSISKEELEALGFNVNDLLLLFEEAEGVIINNYRFTLEGNGKMENKKINMTNRLSGSVNVEISEEMQNSMELPVNKFSITFRMKLNSLLTK